MKISLLAMGFIVGLMGCPAWAQPLAVNKIASGVYVHVGKHRGFDDHYDGDIANIGFVVGSTGVAIIDTGGSYKVGAALREAVRAVTGLPIRYVINTHVHPDHVFGNAAFIQDKPEFIGHVNLPPALARQGDAMVRVLKQTLGSEAEGSDIILPTQTVTGDLSLELGDRKLRLKAWPKAHTQTDLTVLDDKTHTLWTGDLLFISRTPSLDGDLKGWIATSNRLKDIQAQITVPGHGEPTVDKNGMLDKQTDYLNLLLTDVRAAIRNGVDLLDAMGTAAQAQKANWVLFESVNRRNVNVAYPQLEWE